MTPRLEKRRRGFRPSTAEFFVLDTDKRRDPRVGRHNSLAFRLVQALRDRRASCLAMT